MARRNTSKARKTPASRSQGGQSQVTTKSTTKVSATRKNKDNSKHGSPEIEGKENPPSRLEKEMEIETSRPPIVIVTPMKNPMEKIAKKTWP